MDGVLLISEDAAWSPAGWVFERTLEALVIELQGDEPVLARTLRTCRLSLASGCSVIDLRRWETGQLSVLLHAVDAVYAGFKTSGSGSVPDYRFYPGLMRQLSELRALLHSELAMQRDCQFSSPSVS